MRHHPPAPFHLLCPAGSQGQDYLVRVSHLEVYNEEIRDLLSKDPRAKLDLRESPDRGVYVKGLREFVVKSAEEMAAVLQVREGVGSGRGGGRAGQGRLGTLL